MKKLLVIVLAVLMIFGSLLACTKKEAENTTPMRVVALAGPTGMGLAYLMEEKADTYMVELATAPDQITSKFITGEVDIAAVPINLAAVLNSKTEGGAVMIAINTLGVLYILENGDSVQSMADLSGKTLYCTGQGSTPEYTINYLLEKNGLTDVTIEYVAEHSALATQMVEGSVTLAMLPEPHVSTVLVKNADARIAIDLNEQWLEATGTDLVQGCFIVRREYLEQNPEMVERFLADAKSSQQKLLNESDAASIVVKQGILGNETVAAKAIPSCNVVCITGEQMANTASAMLSILFESNPKSIGGSMPNEDFYYLGN